MLQRFNPSDFPFDLHILDTVGKMHDNLCILHKTAYGILAAGKAENISFAFYSPVVLSYPDMCP